MLLYALNEETYFSMWIWIYELNEQKYPFSCTFQVGFTLVSTKQHSLAWQLGPG